MLHTADAMGREAVKSLTELMPSERAGQHDSLAIGIGTPLQQTRRGWSYRQWGSWLHNLPAQSSEQGDDGPPGRSRLLPSARRRARQVCKLSQSLCVLLCVAPS